MTKCLISFFSCRTWAKHYTGKTTDRFRYKCNNYKMEAGKAESGDMENVKPKFLQSHFLRVAVSSCEYIVCFWSSSFRRALVADWSFSVFAMFVINNQNLAIVLFNCRSNEEIIFDKMSKRQKSKLVFFCLFYPFKWFVGLNDKKIRLKITIWLRRYLTCSRRDPDVAGTIFSK